MIVRNEAPVIARALRSARACIHSYSIADTGSTDDTEIIVAHELDGIPGALRSDRWVDFSYNRNLAMRRAKGDWIFVLDADETLEGELKIPEGDFDAFAIQVKHKDMHFWSVRVLKNDGTWRYEGVVHEHPQSDGEKKIAKIHSCCIVPLPGGHQSVTGNKIEGHLPLLEKAPKTPRNVFYHANTLRDLGRTEEAIAKYCEYIAMNDWDQQTYISLLAIARMTQTEADYRAACEFRPSRCEARVELCQLLRN
jgi:glycosyltransferase involved in cell wall biosynthesis